MELTGNKWIDVLIVFITGGTVFKLGGAAWTLITAKFEWRTKQASTKNLEFDAIKKEIETLAYLQMELKRLYKESAGDKRDIEEISERARKEIREITAKSLQKYDDAERRNTELYQRTKSMRNEYLVLIADGKKDSIDNR